MIKVEGCKLIVLDHITIAISGLEIRDERKSIDVLMTQLRSLIEETGVGIVVVSHLKKTDEGKTHEEGGTISLLHTSSLLVFILYICSNSSIKHFFMPSIFPLIKKSPLPKLLFSSLSHSILNYKCSQPYLSKPLYLYSVLYHTYVSHLLISIAVFGVFPTIIVSATGISHSTNMSSLLIGIIILTFASTFK